MSSEAKKPSRKRHVPRPDIRANLLDAAEAIIREEGYAAATARGVANRAGLKHQAIFYYFGSQDELLVEVFQRAARAYHTRLEAAFNSPRPISEFWGLMREPDGTSFYMEFLALANHNEAIRNEIARSAEETRRFEAAAIERYLQQRGITPLLSPNLVSILTTAVARLLIHEANLGIHLGHDEAERLVAASLESFEGEGKTNDAVVPIVSAMTSTDEDPAPTT